MCFDEIRQQVALVPVWHQVIEPAPGIFTPGRSDCNGLLETLAALAQRPVGQTCKEPSLRCGADKIIRQAERQRAFCLLLAQGGAGSLHQHRLPAAAAEGEPRRRTSDLAAMDRPACHCTPRVSQSGAHHGRPDACRTQYRRMAQAIRIPT